MKLERDAPGTAVTLQYLIGTGFAVLAVVFALWQFHIARPHAGAATEKMLTHETQGLHGRLDRLKQTNERQYDSLRQDVRELATALRTEIRDTRQTMEHERQIDRSLLKEILLRLTPPTKE